LNIARSSTILPSRVQTDYQNQGATASVLDTHQDKMNCGEDGHSGSLARQTIYVLDGNEQPIGVSGPPIYFELRASLMGTFHVKFILHLAISFARSNYFCLIMTFLTIVRPGAKLITLTASSKGLVALGASGLVIYYEKMDFKMTKRELYQVWDRNSFICHNNKKNMLILTVLKILYVLYIRRCAV
jgi:hypothetical protein